MELIMKMIYQKLSLTIVLAIACCNNAALAMENKVNISSAKNRIKVLMNHLNSSENKDNNQIVSKNCSEISNTVENSDDPWRYFTNFEYDADPGRHYNWLLDKNVKLTEKWNPDMIVAMHGYEGYPYSFHQEADFFWKHKLYMLNCNPHGSLVWNNESEKTKYTALGQEYDALVILAGLLVCNDKGIKKVYGLGESRGGAAWITALAMLSDPYTYESWWKRLCVVKNDALDIEKINSTKKMVQNGIVYLGYPLLDMEFVLNLIDKIIPGGKKEFLSKSIKFSADRPSPHVLLKALVEKNEFNIVMDLAKDETVVGDTYNKMFKSMENEKFKVLTNQSRLHGDREKMVEGALKVYLKDLETNKN